MKGSRPPQAALSRDTDMSKTAETKAVIEGMVDGLNDHRIGDIGEFFADGFRWMGNFNDLDGETRQLSAAATSSVLTIIGVAILLSPVVVRTWRDFKDKK